MEQTGLPAERIARERAEEQRIHNMKLAVDANLDPFMDLCDADGMTAARVQAGMTALGELPMPPDLADVSAYWADRLSVTRMHMERRRLFLAAQELEAAQATKARAEDERIAALAKRKQEEIAAESALIAAEAIVGNPPLRLADPGGCTIMATEQMPNSDAGRLDREVRPLVPKRAEIYALMKRCQVGVGGQHALDNAHNIMADCYGTLGALAAELEVMHDLRRELQAEIARLQYRCAHSVAEARWAERERLRGYFREALADHDISWPGEVDILYDKCFGCD